jgi:hypothetical protein
MVAVFLWHRPVLKVVLSCLTSSTLIKGSPTWPIRPPHQLLMSPLTVMKIECPVLDDALLFVVFLALFSSC